MYYMGHGLWTGSAGRLMHGLHDAIRHSLRALWLLQSTPWQCMRSCAQCVVQSTEYAVLWCPHRRPLYADIGTTNYAATLYQTGVAVFSSTGVTDAANQANARFIYQQSL